MSWVLYIVANSIARITRKDPSGVEARLRGLGYRDCSKGQRVSIGRNVQVIGRASVELGERVALYGNAYLNAAGPHGRIVIGKHSHVDQFCVLYGQGGLTIGDHCAIASGVIVYTQTNQYTSAPEQLIVNQPVVYAPVRIGSDVWIGANAVVLPGVSIGDHAVVGAGAVVRCDVGEWEVVAGVPARVIGMRRRREQDGGSIGAVL